MKRDRHSRWVASHTLEDHQIARRDVKGRLRFFSGFFSILSCYAMGDVNNFRRAIGLDVFGGFGYRYGYRHGYGQDQG